MDMPIAIALAPADVECLRSHLPDGTDLSRKLDRSELTFIRPTEPPAGISSEIDCEEGEACALLRVAARYSSEAFKKILHSMNVAGLRLKYTGGNNGNFH